MKLNDIATADFGTVFDIINAFPDNPMKVQIAMQQAFEFANEDLFFNVAPMLAVVASLLLMK